MLLTIPQIWLWTYAIPNEQITDLVLQAFGIGYRHIDTAQKYENEEVIGKAIQQNKLPRDQYRITTKIAITNYTPERCRSSIEQSCKNLKTEYIDLVLLHRPNTRLGHHHLLDILLEQQQTGKIHHIGVSNFPIAQLEDAIQYTWNRIFTNQIELHPFLDQYHLRTYCQQKNILVSAYSPLAHGAVFGNENLQQIAEKHNATVAQVALAWTLFISQWVVLPKASSRERLVENLYAWQLILDAEDIATIHSLPKDRRWCNPPFHPLRDD